MGKHKVDIPLLLLSTLCLFVLINNLIVLSIDHTPFCADAAGYYRHVLQLVRNGVVNVVRPPLFNILTIPCIWIGGEGQDSLALTNTFVFIFLLIAVYVFGTFLFSKYIGLLASIILSSYPIVFGQSRVYMPDLLLTLVVVLSFRLLFKTDGFHHRVYSLWWGVMCGFGMLTKPEYILHVIGPVLFFLFLKRPRPILWKNVGLALLCAGGLAAWWYIPFFSSLMQFHCASENFELRSVGVLTFDIPQVMGCLIMLAREQIYGLHFLIFFGVISFIAYRGLLKKTSFLLVWILSVYLIFELCIKKNFRYTIPYLPACALITSFGIFQIQRNAIRRVVVGVVSCVCIWHVLFFTYSDKIQELYPVWRDFLVNNKIELIPHLGLIQPNKTQWHLDELGSQLKLHMNNGRELSSVALLGTEREMNELMRFYLFAQNIPVKITFHLLSYYDKNVQGQEPFFELDRQLQKADYVILTRPLDKKVEYPLSQHALSCMDSTNFYRKTFERTMPDAVKIELYERKKAS